MKLRKVCAVTLALAFAGIAGCDWFNDPSPDDARLSLSGTAGETVDVILSKQFITGITDENITQVELFSSDTLILALPFDTSLSISEEQRFFVRAIDTDTVPTELRMQVFIDGESKFDQQATVTVEQLLFLFAFNQPITSFIELL